ncbi:tyrosine-type recombinase/integrase [Kitasatospora sp. NPDC101801]|uniref:tyrosine-type recombinase/integrase n=1 Tax=Kitasatospora sp. NPDC101801 TaxID=3364103 RepID=UPI003820E59D
MARKRTFGRVRKLPSGRWQARYPGPDGIDRPAPKTFGTKKEADDWLAATQTELRVGDWMDPDAGRVIFGPFGKTWITERGLAERTEQLYLSLLRLHLAPTFEHSALADITPASVRAWRATRRNAGVGASTIAKAYALLRAILNTAVQDRLIRRNPCQIKGGSKEETPERPLPTVPQVYALAAEVPERYRALVLVAAFSGLRWGELLGLTRRDVDTEAGTLRVRRSVSELANGERIVKLPKTKAGVRTVGIPDVIRAELAQHLETFAERLADGSVFIGEKGAVPRRNHFNRLWRRACVKVGVTGLHFHDLRHLANSLAAMTGASTRELMTRMGHSSTRAALIYQHASNERENAITRAVSDMVERERDKDDPNGHVKGTTP